MTEPDKLSREQQTQELISNFRNTEKEMVTSSINEFYQGLVVDPLRNSNKLPEKIFVDVFLPYFRGDKDFKESGGLLGEWYAIAGSHVSEVQIVDSSGLVLYNVPPYINNKGVNATHNVDRKEMSLHDIDGSAEAMSRNLPIAGRNFRERKMAEKIIDMTSSGDKPKDYLSRWKEIFDRYEPKQSTQPASSSATGVVQKNRISEDEMDF